MFGSSKQEKGKEKRVGDLDLEVLDLKLKLLCAKKAEEDDEIEA